MADSQEFLRSFLAQRDEPCPSCDYNLRSLTTERCPECNQELCLRVGLAEPKLAWFVSGLVGIGMGLGFSSLLMLYAIVASRMMSRGSIPSSFWHPVICGTLIGIALLMLWVRARRRIGRLDALQRWTLTALASGISLIAPIWFTLAVR